MPLFKRNTDSHPVDENQSPTRSRSIFSHRSPSPLGSDIDTQRPSERRGGYFQVRRPTSTDETRNGKESPKSKFFERGPPPSTTGSGMRGGVFGHRSAVDAQLDKDPTIIAARQKMTDAEAAVKEAEMALKQARMSAEAARGQSKILKREEDAARAKAKQAEAKVVSKTVRNLGRHR